MEYTPLSKIYYHGISEYARVYQERFNSPSSIHLNFQIGDMPAFFLRDEHVYQLAYEISKSDKRIAELRHNLPGIALNQYSKKCLIDEIVLTNNIEGVHSSRQEVGEALDVLEQQAMAKRKHPRFEGLVNKYLKLLHNETVPLDTCQDIRNLYDELFLTEVISEDANNKPDGAIFRKNPTSIYSQTQKVIHHGLYPEEKIISALDQALFFLNDQSVDPLFRICIFHFLFEYIHPFYDGNGRLGRFILSYCISDTLEPLLAYRISETIKENINTYYKAFEICNHPHNRGDITPFLLMQLQMILSASQDLERSLTQRLIRWKRYQTLIPAFPEARTDKIRQLYHVLIQAALFSETGISVQELNEPLGISSTTIRRLLSSIPSEYIYIKTKGKTHYYQINLATLDEILLKEAQS